MSQLFTPTKIGPLTLSNRIVIAPMCQYSAEDGCMNDWHLIHLGHMALSGAGLLIIEASAVEEIGRITYGCVGLYSDQTEAAMKKTIDSVRKYASMPLMIQLAHSGRKASSARPWEGGQLIPLNEGGWQPVGPSAIPHLPTEAPPQALDKAGLTRIREAFVDAARRSVRLGFDGIQLHCAHGYLLHQFLSPVANQRTDEYGGSLANRMRFPLEVFDAVRAVTPSGTSLGIRLSVTDWVEGGWTPEESVEFCNILKTRGCDFIDVSSAGVSSQQKIPLGPKYQVPLATTIKKGTGLPTIAVGLITDAKEAEEIIANGEADMVALARGIMYDARWPWHAAAELGATVQAPKQYWRSQPRGLTTLFGDAKTGGR